MAKSCENCIWAKRYAKVEKPEKTADEIWESKTFYQKVMCDYMSLVWEVELRNIRYDQYENHRRCTRFPNVTDKYKDDLCGEYSMENVNE